LAARKTCWLYQWLYENSSDMPDMDIIHHRMKAAAIVAQELRNE